MIKPHIQKGRHGEWICTGAGVIGHADSVVDAWAAWFLHDYAWGIVSEESAVS